jgi:hypothetical protein
MFSYYFCLMRLLGRPVYLETPKYRVGCNVGDLFFSIILKKRLATVHISAYQYSLGIIGIQPYVVRNSRKYHHSVVPL